MKNYLHHKWGVKLVTKDSLKHVYGTNETQSLHSTIIQLEY